MGAMKRFAEEFRERRSALSKSADELLTWTDIERLTYGCLGTFQVACPYCGPYKFSSSRFKIDRPSLSYAAWHCFYCGADGTLRAEGIDPAIELEAQQAQKRRQIAAKEENKARALKLWDDAVPVAGTPVIDYLRARAIHDLPPNVDAVLRYHPACQFGREGQRRCLVALFRDVRTNERRAIHRTWLGAGGKALGRMALGPIARAAIKLWPAHGEKLVVGEGIETTLAAALHLQRSDGEILQPAWALTVARNLEKLPVIRSVRRLIILADNDESGVGQNAAALCSQRWCDAGRGVLTMLPDQRGTDFNDVVRGIRR
jgi:Toprim domain-containing protein